MSSADTIFGDWGTSRLRLLRLSADGSVEARAEGPGIGTIQGSPADALRATLAELMPEGKPRATVLCGMAGSRNGLVEAPYAECPAHAADWCGHAAGFDLDGIAVSVLPGLACTTPAGAPDVMRGEETQIFGAMALEPRLASGSQLIALPGTHSKWSRVEDGAVIGFQTWFTGELFALLQQHSTLARAGAEADGQEQGFEAGLARANSDPDLTGALFTARAAQLREGRSHGWAMGYLSGLLIGHEVRAAADAASVTLIGSPTLNRVYSQALAARGIASHALDGEACAVAGLLLHESLGEAG